MKLQTRTLSALVISSAVLFSACGKATVKPGTAADGFTLAALRTTSAAVIVDAEVATSNLTPSYQEAFKARFGKGDSLSSYLAARLLDSLNRGTPKVPTVAAPALNPRYILIVRDLMLARGVREVPSGLLPTGAQQGMQAAGGGTSESWTFSFVVNVWETAGRNPEDDDADSGRGVADLRGLDSTGAVDDVSAAADTLNGLLRYSFSVNGVADVPLYAYKTALEDRQRRSRQGRKTFAGAVRQHTHLTIA